MKINYSMLILALGLTFNCLASNTDNFDEFKYGIENSGSTITIHFNAGESHNHPLYAIWLADEHGKYIQTLYVAESIGKGVFKRSNRKAEKWEKGEKQRVAALPYWAHQRSIKNEYGTYNPTPRQPVPDAYTGATPTGSFSIHAKTEKVLKGKYKILLEVNQPWDWNEFWTNNLYPDNSEYKTSSQPALIYEAEFDTDNLMPIYFMKPIGHSHYAGENGLLFTDLSTITTALNIAKSINILISK